MLTTRLSSLMCYACAGTGTSIFIVIRPGFGEEPRSCCGYAQVSIPVKYLSQLAMWSGYLRDVLKFQCVVGFNLPKK